jgi:sugar phosphate isomerase/epimerase
MFALSLSWNSHKQQSIEKQIAQIAEAGFKAAELNFSLTERKVSQIDKLRKAGRIKIVSCHNFCPIPPGIPVKKALPDFYSLSSLNEKRRLLAVKYTKRSVDAAVALGAAVVVLHSGRVEIPDTSKQLMALFAQGKQYTAAFGRLAQAMRKQRGEKSKFYLEQALASIEEVAAYAQKRNIKIALENRIYYPEIPQLDEFELLLNKTMAFFWFDTGHACIMQKLWSINLSGYLKRYASKLVGIHLHDVNNMRDHLAPGTGEFDFSILKPYIKPATLKVIEAHAPATRLQLQNSVKFLEQMLG